MDDGSIRSAAGPDGRERRYRVSLTRHCLASGRVQLPYALRNRFPEGVLLARDADRDENLHLYVTGPRNLEGLAEFFTLHDVQVNDQIEFHFGDEAYDVHISVRRLPHRGPRRDSSRSTGDGHQADTPLASPQAWRDRVIPLGRRRARPDAEADPTIVGATDVKDADQAASAMRARRGTREAHGNAGSEPHVLVGRVIELESTPRRRLGTDVVDRFGSVTVRRLGSNVVVSSPETMLIPRRSSPDRVASPRGWTDTPTGDQDRFDASWIERDDDHVDDAMLGRSPTLAELERRGAGRAIPHGHDATTETGPQTTIDDANAGTNDEPHVDPRSSLASPRRAAPPETVPHQEAGRPASQAPERPLDRASATLSVHDLADLDAPTVARRRGYPSSERLDDASLEARVAAWFADPSRPVVVRLDTVRDAFQLDDHETLAVVDAVLARPPRGVTLTQIGPGRVRVGRTS